MFTKIEKESGIKLATIKTIEDYKNFDFKDGQVFTFGVLTYSVVDIDGQLWTKGSDGHGGELKVDGMQDTFKWAIECKQTIQQVK
jgi:hypothetical protein